MVACWLIDAVAVELVQSTNKTDSGDEGPHGKERMMEL